MIVQETVLYMEFDEAEKLEPGEEWPREVGHAVIGGDRIYRAVIGEPCGAASTHSFLFFPSSSSYWSPVIICISVW